MQGQPHRQQQNVKGRVGTEKELLFEKPLPHNPDAERLILGVILLDNTTLNQAADALKPSDFFLERHKLIYEQMLKLYDAQRAIDPLTLQDELRKTGVLELVGGPAYIASLFDGVPRFSNIDSYVKLVRDSSLMRKLAIVGAQITNLAFDNSEEADDILAKAEKMVLDIADDRVRGGFIHVGAVVQNTCDAIEKAAGSDDMITGLATGFTDIDYMTSGLQRGDLIIIAARPSMGKTALALNISQKAALKAGKTGEKPVIGLFSLEMSNAQLGHRLISSRAKVDSYRMKIGKIELEEWRRIAMAVGELGEAQLFLDDTPGLNTMQMRAKARRLKHEQKGLDLLVVDYLQLMSGRPGSRPDSRQNEVAQISRELKLLAKELNVPIIALSQLSRAPETRGGNSGHKPQLSDLRDSGGIEQDADVVMFIYREEVYKPETERQGIAELIIAKQRNGPTGVVELVFLKQVTTFEDRYRE